MTAVVNVIIACHNRRAHTLRVLRELSQQIVSDAELKIVLFDDGSTDSTAQYVARAFPFTNILRGDGSAYWARSMALAENTVLADASAPDSFVLWLNDDVSLDVTAIARALKAATQNPKAIIIGATRDPVTGATTYSGFLRSGRHPLRYSKVDPTSHLASLDTFNGNFVLVPIETARRVGGIDGSFSHSWADIDYGLRARKLGIDVLLLAGYVGSCEQNTEVPLGSISDSWHQFTGPKGPGEPRSLARILRRHGGALWPAYFAATYVLWGTRLIRATFRSRAS